MQGARVVEELDVVADCGSGCLASGLDVPADEFGLRGVANRTNLPAPLHPRPPVVRPSPRAQACDLVSKCWWPIVKREGLQLVAVDEFRHLIARGARSRYTPCMARRSVERLFSEGERLSPATRRAILANRDAVIPDLIEIVRDRDLLAQGSKGDGWAPVHAVNLLGKLRAYDAYSRQVDRSIHLKPITGSRGCRSLGRSEATLLRGIVLPVVAAH